MNAFTVPSNEPPPPYTPSAASGSEDPYSFLTQFDTLLLIDDSGSMAGRSWRETSQALSQLHHLWLSRDLKIHGLGRKCRFHPHLGRRWWEVPAGGYRNVKNITEVQQIFKTVKPGGGTPMGTRCHSILRPYLYKLEAEAKKNKIDDVKPLNILAITDGVPSDDVESVIVLAAKKLDALDAAPHQVGIQFFQVGNEEGAAEALRKLARTNDEPAANGHNDGREDLKPKTVMKPLPVNVNMALF
jgi:uncharacterized protein YegL